MSTFSVSAPIAITKEEGETTPIKTDFTIISNVLKKANDAGLVLDKMTFVFPAVTIIPQDLNFNYETTKSIYPDRLKAYIHRVDMPLTLFIHPTARINHLLPKTCDNLFLHVYCPSGVFVGNKVSKEQVAKILRGNKIHVGRTSIVIHATDAFE